MSHCTDNHRLGRIGCGASFSGELQHSVAKVPWSTHSDGMAHITGRLSTIDLCWRKGTGNVMANPADIGLEQDHRGVWRQPMTDAARARLADRNNDD
jgi:hypothetical protein